MHYRNGREAKNGDKIVKLGIEDGKIEAFGVLRHAEPGNDYCNGKIVPVESDKAGSTDGWVAACLCDSLHVDDVAAVLAEKGLDKRPSGK
jgi:hypothetical protein